MIRSDEETSTSASQSVDDCILIDLPQNTTDSKENESLMVKEQVKPVVTTRASTNRNLEIDDNTQDGLLFSIDESPPWHITLLLAFQHYLTMIGGTISVPFLLSPALCIEDSDPVRSSIISTIIFVSGIITVLQSTIGSRLPIIQGGSFSFVVPTFAILSLPEWKCPAVEVMANMTYEDKTELWQQRMREIQGAIIVASLFEVAVGMFGIVGLILRFITPLTIAPSITMVGMSLFRSAGDMAGTHWGISSLTIGLLILFSLYLRNVKCVYPSYKRNTKSTRKSEWIFKQFDIFTLLPVLLSIGTVWIVCIILTVSGVLSEDSAARTDRKVEILLDAPWFRVPYPGQWGWPTVSLAAVFGIFAGVLASSVESIGDYYACARLAGAKPPPNHAINRGLMMEGFGCVLAGLFGTGNGTTSISQNIGAIGITKVGSRRVVQVAGVILLICGVLSKVGALFITMPIPILGGIFCVMFAMITATGLANLQFIDLNSSRNLLVLGFSIFFSLVLSQWMKAHPDAIDTGYQSLDQILTVLLSTTMFLSGIIGFILDNTVPGTAEERGLTKWLTHQPDEQIISSKQENNHDPDVRQEDTEECSYDIPYITPWLKKQSWASYVPFLPSYGFQQSS